MFKVRSQKNIIVISLIFFGIFYGVAQADVSQGTYNLIRSQHTQRCLTAEQAFGHIKAIMTNCLGSKGQSWEVMNLPGRKIIRSNKFPSHCLRAWSTGTMEICTTANFGAATLFDWQFISTSNYPPAPRNAAYQILRNSYLVDAFVLQDLCYFDDNTEALNFYYFNCNQLTISAQSWEFYRGGLHPSTPCYGYNSIYNHSHNFWIRFVMGTTLTALDCVIDTTI